MLVVSLRIGLLAWRLRAEALVADRVAPVPVGQGVRA
jgi:hypothetical protein